MQTIRHAHVACFIRPDFLSIRAAPGCNVGGVKSPSCQDLSHWVGPLAASRSDLSEPNRRDRQPAVSSRIAGKPVGANGNSARRLLQQLSRLAHVNVDHLGAHTGFLRPASCDEFITADHLSGFSSMWRSNLNSIGPRGISPRCCKHGRIELHLDVAICQWSALLRQFRDGSPIASLRRWSRSYCGANGLMKRSSTPGSNSRC